MSEYPAKKSKHLVFISTMTGSPWGGSESLWFASAMSLLGRGYRVTACFKRWGERESRNLAEIRQAGGQIIYWETGADMLSMQEYSNFRPSALKRLNLHFKQRGHAGCTMDFLSSIELLKPDLVFFSQGGTFDVAQNHGFHSFIERPLCPYILMSNFNSDRGFSLVEDLLLRARQGFSGAVKNLFVAERNLRCAERQVAATIPKAEIVRYPVNLTAEYRFDSMPKVVGPIKFAQVARLDTRAKGHDVLFEVLSEKKWKDREWELNLFGDGPDRFFLKELVRFFGIEDRVRFHGHVQDIRVIWQENHLCLLPSIAEGTPISLLEAMFCGRPSVVTDVGGNAEVIQEGETGWVAECASPSSFGAAMERAWSSRTHWASMGAAAHARAHEVRGVDPVKVVCKIIESHLSS